jgi:hypothetical protein
MVADVSPRQNKRQGLDDDDKIVLEQGHSSLSKHDGKIPVTYHQDANVGGENDEDFRLQEILVQEEIASETHVQTLELPESVDESRSRVQIFGGGDSAFGKIRQLV